MKAKIAKILGVVERKSKVGIGEFVITTVQLEDGSHASGIGHYKVGETVSHYFDHQYNKPKIAKLQRWEK